MKKNRRILTVVIAMLLAVTVITPVSVSAANVCSRISGNSDDPAVTFKITTGKGWISGQKVTMKQTKGQYRWKSSFTQKWKKPVSCYSRYLVTVRNAKTGKIYKYNEKVWKDKTMTLSLAKNQTYKVTVKPDGPNISPLRNLARNASTEWYWLSYWEITKTRNISLCR